VKNLKRGNLRAEIVNGDAGTPLPLVGTAFRSIAYCSMRRVSALGVIRRPSPIFACVSPRRISTNCRRFKGVCSPRRGNMLKRGGRLVYATCTVTRSENRDVVAAFFCAALPTPVNPPRGGLGRPGPPFGEADEFGRQIFAGRGGCRRLLLCCLDQTMKSRAIKP